ncbi:peptidase S41 [Cohnella sp. CIP 111063]|uniref:S41 family peptidase n=1 Tax=unclassified Cohnella TaxID=2636738 RepID=UPI000B8BE63B|nr:MULTISPECIES: S41 family peptidase [unclassified Cohnella]OXS55836.1 peptidase S41 [Cohnella sp. CIP 111063]PRX67035.1 carboxyl-terminal processing protease [Cohnella sp. SGD-V74]
MWFRGRTVAAMLALTAVAACVATYAVLEFPGWNWMSKGALADGGAGQEQEGLRQDEVDKLNKAMSLIEKRYLLPADRKKLLDGAVQGMVESLSDPYSVYKPEDEAEQYMDALQGAFTGIGAELRIENGTVVVESPIRGSPAERAGLQPRDVLLSINGESLYGLTLSEAVTKIRGPKGTKAKLKVQRAGRSEPLDLELVRDRIDPETVSSEIGADGIGHLFINQFTNETSAQVAEELAAMERQGLKVLVIDVRNNPGGYLQSVVEVADLLLEKGKPIVQSEYRDGHRKVDVAEHGAKNGKRYPMVVLINKGSASASEILAGALKQSAGALLVGDTTYGKGTVQVHFNGELGDDSLIKLTVYKWLLPDGTWINEEGIEPDIRVAQPDYFLAWRLPRDRVLKPDSTGGDVENLQTILSGVGYPADRSDGYYSPKTREAVERFQKDESLPPTGEVDAETAQRLEEKLYAALQDRANDAQWQRALAEAAKLLK